MILATEILGREVGIVLACAAIGVARSSLYAARQPTWSSTEFAGTLPANALRSTERAEIWETLTSPRFADQTPYEIVPQLLDEGRYLGSIRSFYRVLAENQAVPERRAVMRHPARSAPRLTATQPRQVWTWDITQ